MSRPAIQVENLKELQRQIRALGDAELRRQLRDANKSVSQMIVDRALPNVPVKTGRLKQSVKAQATQTAAYGKAGSTVRVPYAAVIHWGAGSRPGRGPHNIPARPFLWDAADEVTDKALKEYEDQLQQLIEKVIK